MTRAYCLTCNEQVDVDDDGRCPRGHAVSTEDLGPQPWIGRALSAVGNPPARSQTGESGPNDPMPSDPGGSMAVDEGDPTGGLEPTTDEPDELAALLADLDDGGPADLMTEDEPSDSATELAALAEELALRADSAGSDGEFAGDDLTGDDLTDVLEDDDAGDDAGEGDDTLGALDDAMSAWDESDDAIVAPSEPVPDDDADVIPPPPPADAEPPATAPPPPPPIAPLEDLFDNKDDRPVEDMPPPMEEPVDEEPPAVDHAAPREIDLTNFTASGKRVDTSSAPRKKGGLFGFGR